MDNARKTKTVNWGLRKGIWSQVMSFQHMYMNFRRMNKKMYSIKNRVESIINSYTCLNIFFIDIVGHG